MVACSHQSQRGDEGCLPGDLTYAGAIKVDVEFTKLGKDGHQRFTKTGQTIGKLHGGRWGLVTLKAPAP